MRIIVQDDDGTAMLHYDTQPGSNGLFPASSEVPRVVGALAETLMWLSPPLNGEPPTVSVEVFTAPKPPKNKPSLRLVEKNRP